MARAVASAALSATDLATQGEKDGARRPGIRGKAAGARRRPRFAVAAVAAVRPSRPDSRLPWAWAATPTQAASW